MRRQQWSSSRRQFYQFVGDFLFKANSFQIVHPNNSLSMVFSLNLCTILFHLIWTAWGTVCKLRLIMNTISREQCTLHKPRKLVSLSLSLSWNICSAVHFNAVLLGSVRFGCVLTVHTWKTGNWAIVYSDRTATSATA